uniref:Cadherin domain-containing protein n=1 Tax=Parascaris equorum TaxID=6256 RepID=A0A914S2L8_PAREQ
MFRIDELSGGIFPLETFDREKNDSFILDVEARDSAPSSLPGAVGPNKGYNCPLEICVYDEVVVIEENVYHMKLMVTDGKHNTTTDLFIYVEDINDNAPQFDKNLYETTIYEEDTNVPKVLFVVKATDADNVCLWDFLLLRLEYLFYVIEQRLFYRIFVLQVNLRDINDNAPIFANDLFGTVDENREPGRKFDCLLSIRLSCYWMHGLFCGNKYLCGVS